MPTITNQLPAANTLPDFLLTLTALSGEVPATIIHRLPCADSYGESVVKRLKREKLLRTFYRDGLRGLRLTATAKKMLLAFYPDRFQSALTGNTETNVLKCEITRRLRLHRMAEILLTMHNAGICSFPWEKPAVFQPAPTLPNIHIGKPAYYSSREVKEIGPQGAKIRGSRATGVLLTDAGIFTVYNTAASQMRWEYKAELRLKALLQMELCQYRLPEQFMRAEQSAVVFGEGMEPMGGLMGAGAPGARSYFVLDGSYEHFYYLTNDHHGEVILQLLCTPSQKELLDEILLENLSAGRPGWPVEHDAFDEAGAPVLFAYTCDMPRIKRFDTALALRDITGTLICFDFQEDLLRRICGERVAFQSIDFAAFERSVFHLSEEMD